MQEELLDDCPTVIDREQMSYGEFRLMRYPNGTFALWFQQSGHIGVHTGKRRFADEVTARMFLTNCMIGGFKISDL